MKKKPKAVIGRLEKIDFPGLGFFGIDAKIDTGAYSSALHCHDIFEKEENGKAVLYFKLLDPTHPNYNDQELHSEEFTEGHVRSSSGHTEIRYKIKLKVRLGKRNITTDFTLTDRSQMRYPVLLGRKFLNKRFIVDVSEKYMLNHK